MKNIVLFILIICFCLSSLLVAQAADVGDPSGGDVGPTGPDYIVPPILASKTFEDLVGAISVFLYAVMTPLAVIMILYSAWLFMTSGGSEERVTKAKKTLLWTAVGIAIIIIGAGLVSLVKSFLETS